MLDTTPGRYMVERLLPEEFRNFEGRLDGKSTKDLFTRMAKALPGDEYARVLRRLSSYGNKVTTGYGGPASIHMKDLKLPPALQQKRQELKDAVHKIQQDPLMDGVTKKRQIIQTIKDATPEIDKMVMEEFGKTENSFGLQVTAGIRGKPQQLRQLVFGDLLNVDSKHREIPFPSLRSYAEGVTPTQYWAASHGGRQGYIGVQKATADAGYLSKMIRRTTDRQVITEEDCNKDKPFLSDTDDSDIVGSLLSTSIKGKDGTEFVRNTVITEDMLSNLPDRVPIRSAVTCGSKEGLCAHCAGVKERNKLPEIGEYVGINNVNAFLERFNQGGLECLHPDTAVRMADWSVKKLKDIVVGDFVMGVSKDCSYAPAKVLNVFDNGIQPLFVNVYAAANKEYIVLATCKHKILQDVFDCSATRTEREVSIIGKQLFGSTAIVLETVFDTTGVRTTQREALFSAQYFLGDLPAMDIEVDNKDHLFLLENGLIVSNSKHIGGEASTARRSKSGLDAVSQFVNMPETMMGGAAIAEVDGTVSKISDAPQGGSFITVNGTRHHVDAGFPVTVKEGDKVEAGDLLSDGMPNMKKIVQYKGIGEGRRLFIKYFDELLANNRFGTQRKNIESFARGFLNKVRITDPDGYGGYIIDDVVDYNRLAADWVPRESSKELPYNNAIGKYLDAPTMHYSIGTRITPKVAESFKAAGVQKVFANDDPPPFEPFMSAARNYAEYDEEWIPALSGENLSRSFMKHVQRGSVAHKDSTSVYSKLPFMDSNSSGPLQIA